MASTPDQDRVEKREPPHVVNIQFGQLWNVVTPAVYRYEDQKWIDGFFESGRLRLSTFAKFATYPDEVRGDRNEGSGFCYGETRENKSIFVVQSQGISSVVFSCSHRLNHKLREGFQRDASFQIINTVGFAFEIARQLPGFRHGLEGSCIYRTDNTIKRDIDLDFEKYKLPDGNIDMQMLFDAGSALGGPELLLLKRKKFENQAEYRILWELDSLGADFVDVVAPNARRFCRKVGGDEY